MKRIILISALLVICTVSGYSQHNVTAGITTIKKTVTVQDAPRRETGLVGKIGMGIGPVAFPSEGNTDSYNGINFHAGIGYQITPQFYAGAVAGVTGTSHYSGCAIPILGEVRYYCSDNAKSSWFFDAEAGYNPIGLSDVDKNSGSSGLSKGIYALDRGLVAGVGTGWSCSKFSIKINIEYNNSFSTLTYAKADMLFVGWHFDYYFRFGRKY